jgi:hypothetical protein
MVSFDKVLVIELIVHSSIHRGWDEKDVLWEVVSR